MTSTRPDHKKGHKNQPLRIPTIPKLSSNVIWHFLSIFHTIFVYLYLQLLPQVPLPCSQHWNKRHKKVGKERHMNILVKRCQISNYFNAKELLLYRQCCPKNKQLETPKTLQIPPVECSRERNKITKKGEQ